MAWHWGLWGGAVIGRGGAGDRRGRGRGPAWAVFGLLRAGVLLGWGVVIGGLGCGPVVGAGSGSETMASTGSGGGMPEGDSWLGIGACGVVL